MKAPWVGELSHAFKAAMYREAQRFYAVPCYDFDGCYMNAGAPWK